MRKISVKLKVTLWYTIAMSIVSVIILITMNSINDEMVKRDITGRLTGTVDDLSRIVVSPKGRVNKFHGVKFYDNGVHMVLYDEHNNIKGGQIPFGIEEDFEFENEKIRIKTYDGNQYYEYDKEIRLPNRTSYWLKGVISITDESYAVNSTAKNNVIITFFLILAAGAGGYFIISRAFVPVNKIRKTAEEISKSSDLSRRINIGKGNDEISSLANTFDEMLDKIEQTFEREKQFTSDASHELRTPVAVILSECEYMMECAKTVEEFTESVDSVKKQAEKMSKLISELLMISRMDKNTLKLNFEETDISELLEFVCDEQVEIHDDNITLERDISPEIIANTDRSLIARLFINLIANAYQYGKEGGTIKVSLKKKKDKNVFTVSDDGIGIDREDIPKIWERFYQADASRTSDENGSMGLGLSMVKWIAEVHGGSASVESELGKGSKFTFEF